MARAQTTTMLSLDRWAAMLGIHPLEINQITGGGCGQAMFQYAWQHPGRIGREDLAYVIQHAEDLVTGALGFYPLARWSEEVLPVTSRQRHGIFVSQRGEFITGGKMAKTLIDADAAITYSDSDGDSVDDLATISVVTSITDVEQIAVYYPGHSGDDAWEIKPISVSIAAGTATITIPRWQLVLEDLMEMLEPEEIDRDDDASFLEEVDVYRKYNDPSVQAQYEGYSYPCYACSGSGCESCTEIVQSACISSHAPSQGILSLKTATWDADELTFTGSEWACGAGRPMRARIWTRSGWRDPARVDLRLIKMDPRLERAIAILAMSLLGPEGLCVCLSGIHERWAVDLALGESIADGTSQSYKLSQGTLGNPFGTTRGAVEAWRLIREVLRGQAAV